MRSRYYNTEIKRFINSDIIQGNINEGQTLNRYAYVNGNQISKIDPFGLKGTDQFGLGGSLGAGFAVNGEAGIVIILANK